MLEPQDRRLFLESLRPPAGYTLDCAIGTTFSLDLLTMLTVPVAFTAFDREDEDGRKFKDSLALLEALRRHARQISLFCQSGRISIPKRHQALFGYLEDSVFEVAPPDPQGVFHPKVWILRFHAPQEPVLYRLLNLSRNLTFDRSWDTMLALEGELIDRRNAFSQNHPLGDFVASLPSMAVRTPLPERVLADVEKVQAELRRVRFELPNGFEEISFWPLGIKGRRTWPFEGRIDRMLVISPFLSDTCLQRLTASGKGHVLVSRVESLDVIQTRNLEQFENLYTLSDEANPEPEDTTEQGQSSIEQGGDPYLTKAETEAEIESEPSLAGLHAKLFVADAGWNARLWTGSANATDAAFNGNVEFLVELTGKKSRHGIDAIFGQADGRTSFINLLNKYTPSEGKTEADNDLIDLEAKVEEVRRNLAGAGLVAKVTSVEQEYYLNLFLSKDSILVIPSEVHVRCWPVTLREMASVVLTRTSQGKLIDDELLVTFGPLSLEGLTSFLAFEIRATASGKNSCVRFVLNLPLQGTPTDRNERILRSLLKNKEQVLRYLMFLLSEGGVDAHDVLLPERNPGAGAAGNGTSLSGLPIFEEMVRALYRNPERLDQIARLVDDLKKTPEGQELLPEGFDAVWQPIWDVRRGLKV
ncbi:hypothetical protein SY88_02615 [Clostridiales bacterium PH28_bin88]|nr:hypothetical protein SY88_02615 [Clostridiales bacterium PH28_bin88]